MSSPIILGMPTFERHLHEQALALHISPNQSASILRSQIKEGLRSRLSQLGWGTEGEAPELRERLRQAEIMVEARDLNFNILLPFETLKTMVFAHYKQLLDKEKVSNRGSLRAMKARLEKAIKVRTLGLVEYRKGPEKVVKDAGKGRKKGGKKKK